MTVYLRCKQLNHKFLIVDEVVSETQYFTENFAMTTTTYFQIDNILDCLKLHNVLVPAHFVSKIVNYLEVGK